MTQKHANGTPDSVVYFDEAIVGTRTPSPWRRACIDGELLNLMGMVAEPDGRRLCRGRIAGPTGQAAVLGTELAERLIRAGAGEMLGGVLSNA